MKAAIEPRVIEALTGKEIVSVATRGSHVLALSAKGRVYSWGRGDEGQLGHGDRNSCAEPQEIVCLRDQHIWLIAAGRSHSVAVSDTGLVYSWGSNEDGALGRELADGESTSAVPAAVEALRGHVVVQVECGSRHNLVLTDERRVFSWGWGIYGQLGLGDTSSRTLPTELASLRGKKVLRIRSGFRHCFVILPRRLTRRATSSLLGDLLDTPESGVALVDVWGWGWNDHNQLGAPTAGSCALKPVKIMALSSIELRVLAAGGRHTLVHVGIEETIEPSFDGFGRNRSETDPRAHFQRGYQTIAFGRGSDGELGIGVVQNTAPASVVPALEGRKLVGISCGWAHSVALSWDPLLSSGTEKGSPSSFRALFVSVGDIDAFFGLLVQFIIQILLIFQLLPSLCGFSSSEVTERIIPAAAATVAIGNSFFGVLAIALQRQEGRSDVTALPEGINTVLVFAYVVSVMAPEYSRTHSMERAWEAGVFAAFMTGLLQIICIPLVPLMKRHIPRAALLSSIAGVALAFLSMGFAFQVWQNPLIAMVPLFVVLICLGAGVKLPLHVPTGLGALLVGTGSALLLYAYGYPIEFQPFSQPFHFEFALAGPNLSIITRAFTSGDAWKYLTVVVPLVLVNVMSTLANLETAVAVGDDFNPTLSILGDSIATMIGACMGNPFPTNVYLGQPIYKSMGARVSYVFMTAIAVILIAALNATTLIINVVPLSCGVGFLLWIGLVISASSFNRTPSSNTNHGTAVALGMVPAFASWAFQLVQNAISTTYTVTIASMTAQPALELSRVLETLRQTGVNPTGMIALSQGYLLSSIFLASTMVSIIEREFLAASVWMAVAAFLSSIGAVHAFEVDGAVIRGVFGLFPGGWDGLAARYAVAYLCVAIMLLLFHLQEGEISVAPLRRILRSAQRLLVKWQHRHHRPEEHTGEKQHLLSRASST